MPAKTVYFTAPQTIEVREESVQQPGPNEATVRATLSMISPGTELLIYRGEAPVDLSADETIDSLTGSLEFPLKFGYAVVGEVIDVGDNVDEYWLGDQVVCFHPHASQFTTSVDDMYRVPSRFSAETAALLPYVETAINFILDGTPKIGERTVVFGQGLIGLLTTALLAKFPTETIAVLDPIQHRRDIGVDFGADHAFNPDREDVPAAVTAVMDDTGSTGADLTYELSGDPDALDAAIAVTGYDGRVIIGSWYGTNPTELELGGRFHRSRIELLSSQVSTIDPVHRGRWTKPRRIEAAWQCLHSIDADQLITHQVSISNAPDAYRLLADTSEQVVGVQLTY